MLTPFYNACLIGILGGWLYGYNTGIIGGLYRPMVDGIFFPEKTPDQRASLQGILTAEILVGAFVGSFISVPLANKYGRRLGLLVCGAIGLLSALALAIVDTFAWVVIMRTVLGLAVGFTGTLCPLYVNEVAPENIRGQIGTVFQISICATILVAQACNYSFNTSDSEWLPAWKWHLQLGLGALPGALLLISSRIVPESPAFTKQITDESIALGNADKTSQPQLTSYNSQSQMNTKELSMLDLFRSSNLRWVFVAVILAMGNQLTGINAIIFYSTIIFKDAGFQNTLVMQVLVVGTWNLVTVFISFCLVERLGRRKLMIGSLLAMCVACFTLGLAYSAFPAQKAIVAILSVMLYIGAFECGPGPLFFLLACETFPQHVQKSGLSLSNGLAWSFNILVSFLFPLVNSLIGAAATFFLFSVICAACMTCVHFYLPETKNIQHNKEGEQSTGYKPLEGDQEVFAGVLRNKV